MRYGRASASSAGPRRVTWASAGWALAASAGAEEWAGRGGVAEPMRWDAGEEAAGSEELEELEGLVAFSGPGGLEVSAVSWGSMGAVGAEDPDELGGSAGACGFGVWGERGEFGGLAAEGVTVVGVEGMSPVRLLGSLCGFMARRSRGRPPLRDPCG